jgi:hypothetical protein
LAVSRRFVKIDRKKGPVFVRFHLLLRFFAQNKPMRPKQNLQQKKRLLWRWPEKCAIISKVFQKGGTTDAKGKQNGLSADPAAGTHDEPADDAFDADPGAV